MQVSVSAANLFHSHRTAEALFRDGSLRYWLTGAPDHRQKAVDPAYIKYFAVPPYLRYGLEKVLPGVWGQMTATTIGDNLFDLLASRYADDCDLFHVFNHQGLISMRRAARNGVPTVVDRASAHIVTQLALLRDEFVQHGLRFPRARWPMAWKHVQEYEEADHIIVSSDFVRRTMVEQGVPTHKMSVVPDGVDVETFRPGHKRDDVFRVLFVGAISLQKGIAYLLEAFKRLNLPNSELVLVGGAFPEMASVLRRYEGVYRFVPGVPQEELVALYQNASVFVMPSIQDGFGMVVAEAMACGVPVITSENVGIPIEDGQQGFVVPIRNPEAIVEKLTYLHENEDARQRMGARAHEFAQQFTWENYERRLLNVYRQVLGIPA